MTDNSFFSRFLKSRSTARKSRQERRRKDRRNALRLEMLETRQLLAVVSAGGFANNGIIDTYELIQNAGTPGNVDVFVNGAFQTTLVAPNQIQVFGSNDDDVLTVNSTNGLIDLPDGIRFFGGAGQDGLILQQTGGPTRESEQVQPGSNPGQGTSVISDGGVDQIVYFEGLEPIQSNVPAATFTITAFPAAASLLQGNNAINYSSHPLANGFGRVTIDSFEPIDFQNKETLVIDAGAGVDTINIANPNTPTGLTGITINGGDSTASDTLIVNGQAGVFDPMLLEPTGAGAGQVNYFPLNLPNVAFTGIEGLTLVGQEADGDAIGVDGTTGDDQFTYQSGLTPASGLVTGTMNRNGAPFDLVPVTFHGMAQNLTLVFNNFAQVGGNDSFVFQGNSAIDNVNVNEAGAGNLLITNNVNGLLVANLQVNNLQAATVQTHDGDDVITVNNAMTVPLTVDGGNPSASDTLNFTGNGDVTVDAASLTVTEAGFAPVSFSGVEHLNVASLVGNVNILGTVLDDTATYQPLSGSLGRITQLIPNTTIEVFTLGALTIDTIDGTDTVAVLGTSDIDSVIATGNATNPTVTVNSLKTLTLVTATLESLEITTGNGNDELRVNSGTAPFLIPIVYDGGAGVDSLLLDGGTATLDTYTVGPAIGSGTSDIFFTSGGRQLVNFMNLEPVVDLVTSDLLVVNANNASNAINYSGSLVNIPDGPIVPSGIVSVDSHATIEFINKANLFIFALAGDDAINLNNPTTPLGLTNIFVDGGDPTASDTVTITGTAIADNITIDQLTVDGARVTGLGPVIQVTTTEHLVYSGLGGNDSLTMVGTVASDLITHAPGAGRDEGALRVNELLGISYQSLGLGAALTVDGGPDGRSDQLIARGTGGSDTLTAGRESAAIGTVAVNSQLVLRTDSIEIYTLDALEGNDRFIMVSPLAAGVTTVNTLGGGPGGSDVLEVLGQFGVADTFSVTPGQTRTDGMVEVNAVDVNYTGVEHLQLNAGFDVGDALFVRATSNLGDNLWTVNAGEYSGDRVQINDRESIDFQNFDTVELINQFGTDLFRVYPSSMTQYNSLSIIGDAAGGGRPIDDVLEVYGTPAADTLTSNATTITLNGKNVSVGGNLIEVRVNTLGGDDSVTLGLGVAGTRKVIDGGDGNDMIDASTMIDATIYGGSGDDNIVGSPIADLIYGGSGNDVIDALGGDDVIYGGDGNDVIIGGAGVDIAYGEDGNDRFGDPTVADPLANDGGNDQFFGGAGSDTLVWDPGDGSDLFEGGEGVDVMIFNGSAGAETFTFNSVGARLEFLRSLGAIDMDLADVEQVNLNANGGADNVIVNDLFGTGVQSVSLNLGGDGSLDNVTVNGRTTNDSLMLTTPTANQLLLSGLTYTVGLTTTEATDTLTLNGNDGNDQITAAPLTEAIMAITLNGGLGHDTLTGDVLNINGGEGNDTLIGGAGNQTFDGGAGDDTFIGNGGTDNVGGGAGASIGDTIVLAGTTGADTFALSLDAAGLLLATINGVTTTYANFIGGPFATSGIEQILVQGLAGDDTLTVDSTNGAIPVPVNYEGGNNADALTLTGGVATANTYLVGPGVGEGTSTIVIGGVTQVVRFSDLEPVIDLVAGPLLVIATNATNAIDVGTLGVNGLVSVDGFETIEFANKTLLTVDALAGDDVISITPQATPITINGDEPSASDRVIVDGTVGADTVTFTPTGAASGTVQVNALGVITLNTVEHLTYSGLGGDDDLTVQATAASDTIVVNQGPATDQGNVSVNSLLGITYQGLGTGAGAALNISDQGGNDRLIVNGSAGDDNFTVNTAVDGSISYQSDVASVIGGTNHTRIFTPVAGNLIEGLILNSLAGSDNFVITASALFTQGIAINAGNPAGGSDRVTANGTAGNDTLVLTLDSANDSLSGIVGGAIQLSGVENLTLSTGGGDDSLTVNDLGGASDLVNVLYASGNDANDTFVANGTVNSDAFTVTPVNATTATVSANGVGPVVEARLNAAATSTFTVAGANNPDSVVVLGTAAADTIGVVKGATTTVAVGAAKVISVPANSTESVTVDGGDGNDVFNVSGTTANGQQLQIVGGTPTSNAGAASDQLNITMTTAGTTAAVPGATPDAGVITNPDGTVAYSGIEFFNLVGAAGANTLNSQGTHDNDTIALQFLGGANRIWINDRAVYTFANFQTVNLNGLFGDDKFSVHPVGLVGVTTINVAGGDPNASDELVVNGTAGNDTINYLVSNTVGSGAVQVTGAPIVNFVTTESLVIDGQGGTDPLTVTSPAGGHRVTVTPGSNQDSGTIVSQAFGAGTASVPLKYQHLGATASITLAGTGDIVEFNGTANSDTFAITGATIQVTNATLGFVTNLFNLTNVNQLEVRGHDGDDVFNVSGSLAAYAGGLTIDGGNPSASDLLNVIGAGGAITQDYGSATISEVASTPISYIGVELIAVNAANANVTVLGTVGDDSLLIKTTGPNSATVELTAAAPLNIDRPVFNASNIALFTVDPLAGDDHLKVLYTAAGEQITVNGPAGTVTNVNDILVNFVVADTEALAVHGAEGNDTFNVTPALNLPIFIDGGDPIGTVPGDLLNVIGAVGFFAGPENDEGGFITAGATVSFDHIESLAAMPIVGCPFLILGTNADDDITVIARDALTHAGANGVQDFTVTVNNGPSLLLLNQPDLFIDAMAGDDDIVIRANAPNGVAWDVNVRVAGGSPSMGEPGEGDRLVVETPNLVVGSNSAVFNPTGPDTGNMVLDENNNGIYDGAGTDSIITFGAFTFDCPPAAFTYNSSAGGVELVQYDGEGNPAVDDNLTINGTPLDDTTAVNPTGIGTGTFTSGASPRFEFRSFDNLTVNSGTGGFDLVEINGTSGPDAVTSNATTVTLGGEVTLGAGIDQLTVNTFDGIDNITLSLAVADLKLVIDAGAADDVVNLSGVAATLAGTTIYGGDGNDTLTGGPTLDLIYGGRGNDVLVGGAGVDHLYGEEGNDTFGNPSATPNGVADDAGNDFFFGGAGSDLFVWEPGDGSDTIEGGEGQDALSFFGGAGAEIFNVFAKLSDPARAILFRNTGNITMDMAGVDTINVAGNASDDRYVIGRANDGDAGAVIASTAGLDPTATLSDLSTTDVRVVNINAATGNEQVFVDGRPLDDNLLVSVESAATGTIRVAGLPYDVRILGATPADRLTVRGNEGDDTIKTMNPTGAGALNVENVIGITLSGGSGNDYLSADAILIGGIGNDFLEGGAGADLLFGNQGDDTMVGGGAQDTYDGGTGFDTILIRGTPGRDSLDVRQPNGTTLEYIVTDQTGTQVENATVAAGTQDTITNVEEARIEAGNGADTIRVAIADDLHVDANSSNSLRMSVIGGDDASFDRLAIIDVGTPDLSILRQNFDITAGTVEIGPAIPTAVVNGEAFLNLYSGIEFVQVLADTLVPSANPVNIESPGIANRLVVFKHDPYEHNNDRNNATHLGANTTINLDPNIDPGPGAFGLPGDSDWYRVEALVTGTIDIQLIFEQANAVGARPGLPGNGDLNINVVDSDGQAIAGFTTSDDNDDNERVRIPSVQGEIYYFQVVGDTGAINAYDVTVINLPVSVPFDLELQDNPANGTTNPPGQAVNSDSGRSQFDNHTYDTTPTILFRFDDGFFLNDLPGNNTAGTPLGDAAIAIPFRAGPLQPNQPGFAIAIFDEGATAPAAGNAGGLNIRQPLGFATQVEPGLYSFTVPAANALSQGSHFLTARVQLLDPATPQRTGWGERSASLEIVVDTTPPLAFFGLSTDATDGLSPDPGVTPQPNTFVENMTNDRNPSFWGTAEANTVVRLYLDANANNAVDATDIFLGMSVTTPLDGTNQYNGENGAPIGQWQLTSIVDLNDPAVLAALGVTAPDGQRNIILTAEDLSGNISTAPQQSLVIFLDTQGPQVAGVHLAETNLVALTGGNSLLFFNSANPSVITATRAITGLQAGDTVVGIDLRPLDNKIYAVVDGAANDRIYTIDPATGAATLVSTLSVNLNGTSFGVDFNPAADRLRIVSDTDQNLRVNVATGAAVVDGALNPGNPNVVAVAYTNNVPNAGFTSLYTIDSTTGNLSLQNPPNGGTQVVIGALGVNFTAVSGFDIVQGTNRALAGLTVGGVTSLYNINLTTGAATLVPLPARIGTGTQPVRGLTALPGFDLFALKPLNALQGPTPPITSLSIGLQDLPARTALFLSTAANLAVVSSVEHYQVRGDHNGIIPIKSVSFLPVPAMPGQPAVGTVTLEFFQPLPDDRFTLTLSDSIVDDVGNKLDGESNANQPLAPTFLSGDGQPGGTFLARFTVDSRPEIATWSQGVVYVDINGNFVWDPEGQDNDATNRDFIYNFGSITDAYFVGNFAAANAASANGFDKIGSYGAWNGVYQFFLDTNDDGVQDFVSNMPAQFQVNGIPVAGNFSDAHPGDEIGLFDGQNWYLDVNGNNVIDANERFSTVLRGIPVVGDFNGDGSDDLATFNNDTGVFQFDLNRDHVTIEDQVIFGFSGFGEKPLAADMNLDGVDDIGMWVPGREGQLPKESGEFHFIVSDTKVPGIPNPVGTRVRNVFATQPGFNLASPNPAPLAFSPAPLGNDLIAMFGDEFALPLIGNFDPPVAGDGSGPTTENVLTNQTNPLDVNSDGLVTPLDALLVINRLNNGGVNTEGPSIRTLMALNGLKLDASGDGNVTPVDALLIINDLNRGKASGESGSSVGSTPDGDTLWAAAVDSLFDDEEEQDDLLDLLASDEYSSVRLA